MLLADHPIKRLIAQGEGLHLDFKQTVSHAPKIARTLAAFANTGGGRLLVGVKDNGNICGIRVEEDFYILQHAALHVCQPAIAIQAFEHEIDGRKVLEVWVPEGADKPYRAPNDEGELKIYLRYTDHTQLASAVQALALLLHKQDKPLKIGHDEREVMELLGHTPGLTLLEMSEKLLLGKRRLTSLLARLLAAKLICILHPSSDGEKYGLQV